MRPDDWTDPEGRPPRGYGCWMCAIAPPVVHLDHSDLCLPCLGRWFPGWSVELVYDWLERQVERAARPRRRGQEVQLSFVRW